ncbi:acyl transferase/acyl hydrolase/lysophospholipase [Mycena crocata]|nr:acyl transferase/acyl hydrolase/lysophospholipase [Mycena crocata]
MASAQTSTNLGPRPSGVRLLSLDGGGIRGLSTLLILQTIMHRIKIEGGMKEPPLPCEYFDLIGGTSTGGIIAIMLGRLRMSIEQAIECYDALSREVFRRSKFLGDGKYSATTLETVIKKIVKERTGDSETSLLDDGALGGQCKIFVCAMSAHNLDAKKAVLFRSYESPKEVQIPSTIWQAARATSATPAFFERVFIGPPTRREPFIDGGLGQNNPAEQVLSEAEVIFPTRKLRCLVSIGTGQLGTIEVSTPNLVGKEVLVAMATDCEDTAERMVKHFRDRPKTYFRFNVDRGLQMVTLDAWDQMDKVSAHTRHYMAIQEVGTRLDDAVRGILGHSAGNTVSTSSMHSTPSYLKVISLPRMQIAS